MSTTAAPAPDMAGGSSTPDPIDSLDLSSIGDDVEMTSDFSLPESMVIDAAPKEVPDAAEDGSVDRGDRGDGRTKDGKFAKQGDENTENAETTPTTPAPFQYRSMGKTHNIDGALIDPTTGNLTIPSAKVAEVQDAFNALQLAQGEYIPVIERHRQNNATLRARVKELEDSTGPKEAQADALVSSLAQAFTEPDDEKALGMLFEMRRNYPLLIEKARASHFEKQLQARAQTPQPEQHPASSPQQASMPAPDAAKSTAIEMVERWKVHPSYRDVPPDAWKSVEQAINTRPYSFYRPATADDAQKHRGVMEGQTVFDTDLLYAEVDLNRQSHAKQRETADAQARLRAANATRTQPSISAPPTPGGGRAPIQKPKTPQTKAEMEAWFESGSLDLG